MASNNFCVDLRLPVECANELDLTPNPETSYQSIRVDGKILVLCPAWKAAFTNCFQPLIQLPDGAYGYDYAQDPSGVITPAYTSDMQFIYSFRFYDDTGIWILQLGDSGDEASINSTQGIVQFDFGEADNVLLTWNDSSKQYEGNDLPTAIVVASHAGEEVCIASVLVPKLLVWYDFVTIFVRGVHDVVTDTVSKTMNWIRSF